MLFAVLAQHLVSFLLFKEIVFALPNSTSLVMLFAVVLNHSVVVWQIKVHIESSRSKDTILGSYTKLPQITYIIFAKPLRHLTFAHTFSTSRATAPTFV